MKRFIALFLTFTFILNVWVFIPSVSAENASLDEYKWYGTQQAISTSKQARYFRTKLLNDGTVGAVYYRSGYGNYFAKSYDGGLTFTEEVALIKNATDSQIANSPYVDSENPLGRGRLEAQNPNFVQLENGNLIAFHRYNTYTGDPTNKPWSFYYSSIQYQISTDMGKTWSQPEIMVECQREKPLSSSSDYGFWEPDPYIINGKLFVYYADTHTPNNLSYQHIMYCVLDEKTQTFTDPKIAQNGIEHKSRDGMSVVTKLNDGNYAMVFESTKTGNSDNTFVIKMSLSKDGENWTHPVIVATPNKVLSETAASSSEKAVCASPHIITLPDGRVAVSYQTTDRYSGIIPDRVSYRIGTQVVISNNPLNYETFADIEAFGDKTENANVTDYFCELINGPGELLEGHFSKSASMLYAYGNLLIYYNIGENKSVNEHTLGAVNVSYAKMGTKTDYNLLENYTALNNSNKEITVDDDTFTLPSSTSTLIAINKNSPKSIDELYNSENYTLYSGENSSGYKVKFNSTNKSISTSSTGKALIKNTEDMTSFTASMDIKGNPKANIIMQAGFGFHLQNKDFNLNYFNTSGYTVFARRLSETSNTVEIAYRYCNEGKSVYSYVAGSYSKLPTDKLDMKFTLKVVVNQDKFYAQLLDEDGKVIINAKEAPLYETASGKGTKYYPTGSLALLTHGTHTLSNIEVKRTSNFIKSNYTKARATFNLSKSGSHQFGFALRAQSSVNSSPGYSGYAIKLVKADTYEDGLVKLQLTRYGTTQDGEAFANLGDIKTYSDYTVLNGQNACDASIIMEAVAENENLTVTLINSVDHAICSTYTFDLSASSKKSNIVYSNYYESGGFGIFNNSATAVTVSNLEFSTEKSTLNKIHDTNFTIYKPDNTDGVKYSYNSFVSSDTKIKKFVYNNEVSSSFSANATFEFANDGKIKSGIIFRAQNVGNDENQMEGYCAAVSRYGSTVKKDRTLIAIYKWVRNKDGNLDYYKTLKGVYEAETLLKAFPDARKSMLTCANAKLKLHLNVNGNMVKVYFEIIDNNENVKATSPIVSYDLSTNLTLDADYQENFDSDSVNTLYGAGDVGLWMNHKGKALDFNFVSNDDDSLNSKLLTTENIGKGIAYTTLNSGSADTNSLVKVIAKPEENYHISAIEMTVGGITTELVKTNGEYSFIKQNDKTNIKAIFRIYADLDGDNNVNATDLAYMRKHLLGKDRVYLADGDLSENGVIDLKDLVKLKKLLVYN